jgi:uncharacterized membrane protein
VAGPSDGERLPQRRDPRPRGDDPHETGTPDDLQILDVEAVEEVVEEVVVRIASRFSGPLPSPDVLQGYERALPGAADRIIKMAERQNVHRIAMERRMVGSDATVRARGQLFGLIIVLAAIGAGTDLILHDKAAGGLVTIIVAIGGIVSAFVLGAWRRGDEVPHDDDDGDD